MWKNRISQALALTHFPSLYVNLNTINPLTSSGSCLGFLPSHSYGPLRNHLWLYHKQLQPQTQHSTIYTLNLNLKKWPRNDFRQKPGDLSSGRLFSHTSQQSALKPCDSRCHQIPSVRSPALCIPPASEPQLQHSAAALSSCNFPPVARNPL